MTATFIVSIILAFTSAGFPYSGSSLAPRVQKQYIFHTKRTFYDENNAVRFTDNGFYILENERNTKKVLDMIFDPESLISRDHDESCALEAFCGYPNYNKTNGFWMKTIEAPSIKPTTLNMIDRQENGNIIEMTFDIVGSFLTRVFLAPEEGVAITADGFTQREWGQIAGNVHYMKVTFGKATSEPFQFKVTLDKTNRIDQPTEALVKVTIATIDAHLEKDPLAKNFTDVIDKFPDYVFLQKNHADVSSYAFK